VTTVLQPTGRESRSLRQARRGIAGAFAAHPGVTTVAADCGQPAGLIRLCDETPQILDTDLGVTGAVRTRSEAALAGAMGAGPSAGERDQRLTCELTCQDNVDLVTIAYRCETVVERVWR
jgi:hypothetical protein